MYKKKVLIPVILLILSCTGYSQSNFERGSVAGELFLTTYVNSPYVLEMEKGFFHITDNGSNIELKYHTRLFADTGTAQSDTMHAHYIVADAKQGVVYNIYPWNGFMLFRSEDYGENWEPILEYNMRWNYFFGGVVEGHLYWTDTCVHFSDNYGDDFEIISDKDTVGVFDVGHLEGELLAREYTISYYDSIFPLYKMENNSGVFNEVSDIYQLVLGSSDLMLTRGANSGELYIFRKISLGDALYKHEIYFSPDYGVNCYLRNISDTLIQPWDHFVTAGRANGSFYNCKVHLDIDLMAWVLYLDYSCDTAKTFKTYFHILDETVGQMEIEKVQPEITVYPNPFYSLTNISFSLTREEKVQMNIYSMKGKLVNTLFSGNKEAGQHHIAWDGKDKSGKKLPVGVYFIKTTVGKKSNTLKAILGDI